jgi:hypothetical protein
MMIWNAFQVIHGHQLWLMMLVALTVVAVVNACLWLMLVRMAMNVN